MTVLGRRHFDGALLMVSLFRFVLEYFLLLLFFFGIRLLVSSNILGAQNTYKIV